jgi:hypothetical protein
MKIGDLVKYNNEWSAVHGLVGVVVGLGDAVNLLAVLGTCGRVFQFSVDCLEVV